MAWTVEFTDKALKQFNALENDIRSRIKKDVKTKIAVNPQQYLEPLRGVPKGFYRFKTGDYRLLCSRDDDQSYVLVLEIKHRKDAYKLSTINAIKNVSQC